MVTIVKKKGNKRDYFYVYDYERNPETGKFMRKYLGISSKEKYEEYQALKGDRYIYCKTCGKRKSKYRLFERQQVCTCERIINEEKQ